MAGCSQLAFQSAFLKGMLTKEFSVSRRILMQIFYRDLSTYNKSVHMSHLTEILSRNLEYLLVYDYQVTRLEIQAVSKKL